MKKVIITTALIILAATFSQAAAPKRLLTFKDALGRVLTMPAIEDRREQRIAKLERLRAEWEVDTNKHTEALAELQEALGLPNPPARIECYDISNTQGTNATGSMVVFAKGVPSKQDYRRFRIKTVQGPNDYASMAEVLKRRFARAKEAEAAESVDGKENRWAIMPDLVIVDGNDIPVGIAGVNGSDQRTVLVAQSRGHRVPVADPHGSCRDVRLDRRAQARHHRGDHGVAAGLGERQVQAVVAYVLTLRDTNVAGLYEMWREAESLISRAMYLEENWLLPLAAESTE